jgi:spermidine synthase
MLPVKGMFGPVQVRDLNGTRVLTISGQVQGGSFLDEEGVPTPIASSAYSYGWLVAGLNHPDGSGLSVGLGSGQGIVQLLNQFPNIDMTVVDIDPVVVETALEHFPLIQHYIDLGRLNIVIDDALNYLDNIDGIFDFGLSDAYTGKGELVGHYHQAMARQCESIYVNVIDDNEGVEIVKVLRAFTKLRELKWLMKAVPPGVAPNYKGGANWILTSDELDLQKLDGYLPFEDVQGKAGHFARTCWLNLISNPVRID